MSEDKNTERRGGGRYSRRTRRKFYYFKAWVAGLGPKKLNPARGRRGAGDRPAHRGGVAMNRSAAASQSAGGSVQLRAKTATSLSGSPDAQSALESEGADGVDVLSITPPRSPRRPLRRPPRRRRRRNPPRSPRPPRNPTPPTPSSSTHGGPGRGRNPGAVDGAGLHGKR